MKVQNPEGGKWPSIPLSLDTFKIDHRSTIPVLHETVHIKKCLHSKLKPLTELKEGDMTLRDFRNREVFGKGSWGALCEANVWIKRQFSVMGIYLLISIIANLYQDLQLSLHALIFDDVVVSNQLEGQRLKLKTRRKLPSCHDPGWRDVELIAGRRFTTTTICGKGRPRVSRPLDQRRTLVQKTTLSGELNHI